MQQFLSTFSTLPVFGCLRDRRGTILSVTQRLLDAERKRAADVVGRRLIDVWPHAGAAWLKLDRAALRARKPVTQLEYCAVSGRWLSSTRIPRARQTVLWVAEDRTAEVQLRALKNLLKMAPMRNPASRSAWLWPGARARSADAALRALDRGPRCQFDLSTRETAGRLRAHLPRRGPTNLLAAPRCRQRP